MERVFLKRFHRNRGKRLAQGWAFQRIRADVVLTVDSDTILDPRCIENGLKPFTQSDVMAVCGNVRVLNRTRNLLTRLLDLRYTNAFVYERAAYSTIDSMRVGLQFREDPVTGSALYASADVVYCSWCRRRSWTSSARRLPCVAHLDFPAGPQQSPLVDT